MNLNKYQTYVNMSIECQLIRLIEREVERRFVESESPTVQGELPVRSFQRKDAQQ